MKALSIFIFFFGSIAMAQQSEPTTKITGFSHPESVLYDEERQQYYVSNMADREDGDGFISRVSKNGKIEELSWITGLKDPKGFVIKDGSLYVTDVTELVEIDIEKGKIKQRIPVPEAKSLNDPAQDEEGNIYFTDLAKGSIYVLKTDGEIEEWLNSPELENPNGLHITDDAFLVSAWGNENPGHFLRVDRNTKKVERISKEGIGNLDGVQRIEEGKYYISDWGSGKIYTIDLSGNLEEVLNTAKSSGDIYYHNVKEALYVPMNHQNEVWIYNMK